MTERNERQPMDVLDRGDYEAQLAWTRPSPTVRPPN